MVGGGRFISIYISLSDVWAKCNTQTQSRFMIPSELSKTKTGDNVQFTSSKFEINV